MVPAGEPPEKQTTEMSHSDWDQRMEHKEWKPDIIDCVMKVWCIPGATGSLQPNPTAERE